MFTGIVEEIGVVQGLVKHKSLYVLTIKAQKILKGVKKGDSISVDGVCLTVTKIAKKNLSFDIMEETLRKTTLAKLHPKDRVNLERALERGARFSGHFVTGHIDLMSQIVDRIDRDNYTELRIDLPKAFKRFVVPKGSICVDGISLTVGEVRGNHFSIYLIPFTKKVTTLGAKEVGDFVNLEIDIIAKYILNRHGK